MYCKNCGKELSKGTAFCTNCGAAVDKKYYRKMDEAPLNNEDIKKRKISKGKKIVVIPLIVILITIILGVIAFVGVKILSNDEEMKLFKNGVVQVEKNGKWGLINEKGELVVDYQYDYISISDDSDLILVMQNEKFGYINRKGETIIKCKYDYGTVFSEGVAAVTENEKCGYIDEKGNFVIKPKYVSGGEFHDDVAAVWDGLREWLIDKKGKKISKKYDSINYYDYQKGQEIIPVELDDKWGYINRNGDEVITPQYDFAYIFIDGLAVVSKEGKYGMVDPFGNWVYEPKYDSMSYFHDGMARVNNEDKYGFINEDGELVVETKYQYCGSFYNGLAPVKENGLWGYINKEGQMCIEPQFEEASSFKDKNAFVKLDGKYMIIDSNGDKVKETDYCTYVADDYLDEDIVMHKDEYMIVGTKYKKFTIINDDYEQIFDDEFDSIGQYPYHFCKESGCYETTYGNQDYCEKHFDMELPNCSYEGCYNHVKDENSDYCAEHDKIPECKAEGCNNKVYSEEYEYCENHLYMGNY